MAAPGSMSPIDVVDEHNEPYTTIERGDALRAGANFRTVHVLVLNGDDQLLVQRLAEARERHGGLWGSSVAGYMHAGEDYDHAAHRRLYEELGVTSPLYSVGVLPMVDEQSVKFVGIYTTVSDEYTNKLPEHIADLEWRDVSALVDELTTDPSRFTDTFRSVLGYWLRSRGEERR